MMSWSKSASAVSRRSIADFFAKGSSPGVPCPACGLKVTFSAINAHLDRDCQGGLQQEVEKVVRKGEDVFDDSDEEFNAVNVPKLERSIFEPALTANTPEKKKTSSSPEGTLRASPHLKRRTNLFGGAEKAAEESEGAKLHLENEPQKHIPLTAEKRRDPSHVPYYVVNFEHVLRCVLDETDDRDLFNEEELSWVKAYRGMALDARRLYVRLFGRKLSWLTASKMKYDEIQGLNQALEELQSVKLLENGAKLEDLGEILTLLPAPSTRTLAKEMNLNCNGQKEEINSRLLKHAEKRTAASFFMKESQNGNVIAKKIKKRARELLGEVYRLEEEPRGVLLRVFSLYSLTDWWDERESNNGAPPQLATILLANQGKLVFPAYEIRRKAKIFANRGHLLR